MKIEGMFKDWEIWHYKATSKDWHCLWISNGFLHFSDHHNFTKGQKSFLLWFWFFERYKLREELRAEIRRRALKMNK